MRRRIGTSSIGGSKAGGGGVGAGRVVAVIAVLVLGLAGCSDDAPESAGWPTPTPRPTPPAPTPDPIRDIRRVKTAEEFIRLWDRTETEMLTTGNTKVYRAITEGCVPCRQSAKDVEGFYAKGGYVRTEGSRVVSIKRAGTSGGWPAYEVHETAPRSTYRESKNGPIKKLSGGKIWTRVTVAKEQFEGWLIVEAFDLPVQP
ncbi:MAG: hypothetical protein ACRCYU_03650 [Nocardioides sp.]